MATLTRLVMTITVAEGLDLDTTALIARYAREAGLIAMKGRGESAAHMTPKDAANLLIAVNTLTTAKNAAGFVPIYRRLGAHEPGVVDHPSATFGEALELIIRSYMDGALPDEFLDVRTPEDIKYAFEHDEIHVEVAFRGPIPSATLRISHSITPEVSSSRYLDDRGLGTIRFIVFERKLKSRPKKKVTAEDRRIETIITDRTLRAVGEALRPHRWDKRARELY
jgi:hypothetical protein